MSSIMDFQANMKNFMRPNKFNVQIGATKAGSRERFVMSCFQCQIPGNVIATTDKDMAFRSVAYQTIYSDIILGFYADDKLRIRNKFVIPSKQCNFIQWLHDPTNEQPYHQRMKLKKPISQGMRMKVWEREFNNLEEAICPISTCTTLLKKKGKGGFHAGHIISERNGGLTEISNLRPICKHCNCMMTSKNWKDFDSQSCS